jgi:hypothetical protein
MMEKYLSEIKRYKELCEGLSEDNPGALLKKIELLSKALVLIGEVSAECDRQYKILHVHRDLEFSKVMVDPSTPKPKKEHAELAVARLKLDEAEAYGQMMKYRNEFESMQETIHYLKLRMRVGFVDGNVQG